MDADTRNSKLNGNILVKALPLEALTGNKMFELIISTTASLFLLVLSVYVILKERTGANAALSFTALLLALIEVTDQMSLHLSYDPIISKRIVLFIESLLPVSFIFFSLIYSRQGFVKSISPFWWILNAAALFFPVSVFFFPVNAFFYSPDLQTEKILFLGDTGYWFYMGMMIYCVIALIHIESTFRASSGSNRWKIKFEVIGIIAVLSVLIFYFSQGLLYRTINMNLIPIRSGVFIIASLFVGYSKIFRGNGVKVVVSRYILYRSLALLLIGFYLLILGLIGEGMKYLGASFSRDLTIFFAFACGILMLLIFLSEKLRRQVKVFISKHFYAHKHAYRDKWLKFTGRLASCKTFADVQEAILTTYKETFGLGGASMYLLDKKKKRYILAAPQSKSDGTLELKESAGLILYFMERGRVFNPLDDEYIPDVQEASFLRQIGATLIVPLICNGKVEGFVVFGKQLVHEKFIYEDYDLMKTLAKQATLSIINFRLLEELIETREVAVVAKISSFVIHDLKNLTSTLSLILDNAEDYIGSPEFQTDMLETVKNTLSKMNNLIQRLKLIPEKHTLNTELADVNLLVREIVEDIMMIRPDVNIVYNGSDRSTIPSVVDTEEIKNVILNLMMNALDAIEKKGAVTVETGIDRDSIYIRFSDNGYGMAEDFIQNQLFKPFRTTKKKGLGIGLYQCKQIIEAHGGSIGAESELGKGTVFTVYLPLAKDTDYV